MSEPGSPGAVPVDLARQWRGASGNGVLWTLDGSSELNVNLVRLDPGAEVGEHVNAEVEVVLAVLEGSGQVVVDGIAHPLGPASLAFLPRGARRAIRAGEGSLVYLSIHRRREGLRVRAGGRR
ncbi:MAG: cupin domain-containing protein [Acidimicrobiales bacterium]